MQRNTKISECVSRINININITSWIINRIDTETPYLHIYLPTNHILSSSLRSATPFFSALMSAFRSHQVYWPDFCLDYFETDLVMELSERSSLMRTVRVLKILRAQFRIEIFSGSCVSNLFCAAAQYSANIHRIARANNDTWGTLATKCNSGHKSFKIN